MEPVPTCPAGYQPYSFSQNKANVEPLLIGTIVSFSLFGIGLLQFYLCFSKLELRSMQDRITFYFLWLLLAADLVDSIGKGLFICDQMRNVIVKGLYGSIILPQSAWFVSIMDAIITMLNHAVYGYRIVRLTPDRGFFTYAILGLSGAISAAQLAGAIRVSLFIKTPLPLWVSEGVVPWASLWQGGAAAGDVILCVTFVYLLSQHKTDFAATNNIITRWIALSLETGIVPSILQVITLTLFVKFPEKVDMIVFGLVMPKVYVMAILIILYTVIGNRAASGGSSSQQQDASNISYSSKAGYPRSRSGLGGHSTGNMQLSSMSGRGGHNPVANGIVVTSEVYRVPDHRSEGALPDAYEKGAYADGSSPSKGSYRGAGYQYEC